MNYSSSNSNLIYPADNVEIFGVGKGYSIDYYVYNALADILEKTTPLRLEATSKSNNSYVSRGTPTTFGEYLLNNKHLIYKTYFYDNNFPRNFTYGELREICRGKLPRIFDDFSNGKFVQATNSGKASAFIFGGPSRRGGSKCKRRMSKRRMNKTRRTLNKRKKTRMRKRQ